MGAANHVRETLEILPSRQDASNREKEIITEALRAYPLCMNCGPGGLGATDRPATTEETRAKLSKILSGKRRTDETRARMRAGSPRAHDGCAARGRQSAAHQGAASGHSSSALLGRWCHHLPVQKRPDRSPWQGQTRTAIANLPVPRSGDRRHLNKPDTGATTCTLFDSPSSLDT